MKIKTEMVQSYADWKAKNNDPYGSCCFVFAERWANRLELLIERTKKDPAAVIAREAKDVAHSVDREDGMGITGFMYGVAVRILAECWEYGEALRQWHNLDSQIHDEGARANVNGGVLNPAVVTIDCEKQ